MDFKEIAEKMVVTKEGIRIGIASDITFEPKSGELKDLIVTEITRQGKEILNTKEEMLTFPYSSILAVKEFIIIDLDRKI